MLKGISAVFVFGSLALALISPAIASANDRDRNITVGNNPVTCPHADFATIQAAVTAANPGDHIKVCPGTYVEQVTIPAGKDHLSLESQKPLQAVIQAPPVMTSPKAIVRVMGAHDVSITQFTIQGPGGGGCDSLEYGVRVDTGGSATIEKNHITHIRDEPFSGCQNGVGVQVGRDDTTDVPTDVTTGSATVKNNLVDDYQKNGVTISNSGSSGHVENNTVKGFGPTATIAQNGIQISDGAEANVEDNDISGNVFTPAFVVSTGILLFSPGDTSVEDNTAHANDVNIFDFLSTSNVGIQDNETFGGTFDGIDVVQSSGATVQDNKAHDNAFDGIFLQDTGTGNTLKNNELSSNGEDGINLFGASNNTLRDNKTRGNAHDGVEADSASTGNTIKNNDAKSNATFDCQDESLGAGTAGTANFWLNDKGQTSSPTGICKR